MKVQGNPNENCRDSSFRIFLAARLVDSIKTALGKEINFNFLLTLFWIKLFQKEFDLFVKNRV